MKKLVLSIATILLANVSIAQWNKKSIDNGLDEPYEICYTNTNNGGFLKLENLDGDVVFYIQGSYFCEEEPIVDISFLVRNEWVKYSVVGAKSGNGRTIFLAFNIEEAVFFKSFLNATSVKVRVNEEYCNTEIFQFNMSGSTSAFNFIKN
jgi:hypothetical protein